MPLNGYVFPIIANGIASGGGSSGGGSSGGSGENRLAMLVSDTLTELTAEDFAGVTEIGSYTFQKKQSLLSVTIAEGVERFETYVFAYCNNLEKVLFPSTFKSVGRYCFDQCNSLKNLSFQKDCPMSYIPTYAFIRCGIEKIVMPNKVTSIDYGAFHGCSNLSTVVLPNNSVVSMVQMNAFESTPFAVGGTGGTVYVPQATIESYKTATNWSALYEAGTCNFVPIEGSEYE